MAIKLKTQQQIEKMRQAGRVVHEVLQRLAEMIEPGMTTAELDREAERLIIQLDSKPLFKGVPNPRAGFPFPACICTSIDDEVVHGIPSDKRVLKQGQIISIDCGVKHQGFCGDAAVTVPVGQVQPQVRKLLDVTRQTLEIAVRAIKPGARWSEVAARMQAHAEAAGFSVVRDFVGHGIGREMHEDPKIPNFVSPELLRNDIMLKEGMVLAVEPMVNMGTWSVKPGPDGWTILTQDGLPSAHFEHTVAVSDGRALVLTDGR